MVSTSSALLLAASLSVTPGTSAGLAAQLGSSGQELHGNVPKEEAVEAFFRGKDLYAAARYEEALESFELADRLQPAPDLQFNIGLCHARLEHWDEAINAFEIYLRTKENPPDRADVEARIEEARRRRDAAAEEAAVAAAEPEDPAVEPGAGTTTLPPDAGRTGDTKSYRGLIAGGSVLLGLGVLGAAGAAGGLAVPIRSKNVELDEIVNNGNPTEVHYAEAIQIRDDAERLRTFQFVALGVGAGVAIVGAALLGVGLKRRASDKRTARAVPSVRPWASYTSGGFTLHGSF